MPGPCVRWSLCAAIAFTVAVPLGASNVAHMTLRDLVTRADRIIRGTVIEADESAVAAGGGSIPIVVYRIRVDEVLKGTAGAGDVIDVRMVGASKELVSGPYRRANILRDIPRFTVGRDYLFALTKPSRIGLSTTVGLGQGLFQLRGRPGQELAVNGANNLGLLDARGARRGPGPVPYDTLVKEINAILGK